MTSRLNITTALFALALAGCGSTSDSANGNETQDGFRLYTELGPRCRAGVATSPKDAYGPFTFIPCESGERGCEQLKWDGNLGWDPVGRGDMLQFSLQPALDSAGNLQRILIKKQYPTSSSVDAVPFEAIVYDLSSGEPIAAFRNPGDDRSVSSDESTVIKGKSRSCVLNVGITQDSAFVLATASDSSDVLALRADLEDASSSRSFEAIDADRSVVKSRIFGGGKTIAFAQDDGRLFRVNMATGAIASDYGPGLRLWLSSIAGDDVLATSATPVLDGYFFFHGEGDFEPIDLTPSVLVGDPYLFAWAFPNGEDLDIYEASRSAPVASEHLVVTIPEVSRVYGASFGDGVLALHVGPFGSPLQHSEIMLVALRSGSVKRRKLPPGDDKLGLLANSETHIYMGSGDAILRFEMSGD